jgi:hypothetical protein
MTFAPFNSALVSTLEHADRVEPHFLPTYSLK